MADNLLDKASILLTPTAYNDGRMLSVKPNENLYGTEEVTNGDFATDSNWSKGTGWTISGGKANGNNTTGDLYQENVVESGKKYKVTYTISNYVSGSIRVEFPNNAYSGTLRSANGTYTETILSGGTLVLFDARTSFTGSIDNVSVVEDLSGDFTFSRSSAATRVNAQGLVENVQIISSELVSNGNFSQIGTEEVSNGNFSQEGSELITNGDFATDSNWTISGSSISISGGKLNFVNATSNSEFAQQSIVAPIGKTYKITLDVSNLGSGESIKIRYPFQDFTINTNGTHILYGVGNTANVFRLTPNSSTASFSIDNVSVKEVGQDWALGTGWSIGDDKAVFDDTTTNRISQTGLSITSGKSYKINFTIADCPTTAHMTIYDGGGSDLIVPNENYVNGSYTRYYTATTNETGVSFWGNTAGDTFTITNISVKEVGQDWTPNANATLSIDNGRLKVAVSDGSGYPSQNITTVVGKKYKITADAFIGTATKVSLYSAAFGFNDLTADGSYNLTFTATSTSTQIRLYVYEDGTYGFWDNISVKEITDDTDLPRINYEGFSYQDSLGSELVVNGDFSNGLSNWTNFNVSLVDGGANLNNIGLSGQITYIKQNGYVSGNSYKLELDVISTNGADLVLENASNTSIGTQTIGRKIVYFTQVSTSEITIKRLSGDTNVVIDNVSVKEVLGQEVVPDSGCGSWLMEGQSTNYVTSSESITPFFATDGTTLTQNYDVSPTGENNSVLLTQNTGSVNQSIYNFGLPTTNGDYSYSFFFRAGTSTNVRFYVANAKSENFNPQTVTAGIVNGVNLNLLFEDYGNGWFRVSTTVTLSGASFNRFLIYPDRDDLGRNIEIFGAQYEVGSYATSYIPTSGAASTRLQDIANNSGNSTLINSTEGVLYAEIAALADDLTERRLTISDGSNSNRVAIEYTLSSNQIKGRVVSSGATSANINFNTSSILDFNKIAISYKQNDFNLWFNGVKVGTDTSGNAPIGLNIISFDNGSGGNKFIGKAKALAVYKEALTDANLRSLTYPNPVATTFDLDFDTIAEQFTFTRGSEATFVNAQGLIESTASNDAPRIDYSTGAKAFLLENQSTNRMPNSEDGSTWTLNNTTLSSLNGGLNKKYYQITSLGNTGRFDVVQNNWVNTTAGTYTASVFAKKGTCDEIILTTRANFGFQNYYSAFDLTNGLVTANASGVVGSIKPYSDGWYRCSITFTNTGGFTDSASLAFGFNFNSSSTDTLFVASPQSEIGSYATSYIPTSGASATRNQELCNNATPVINSEEGTLYTEISALADDLSFRVVSISDGTNNNTIKLGYRSDTNAIYVEVKSASVGTAFLVYTTTSITDFHKIAFKYRLNDFSLWIDGVNVLNDSSGSVPVGLSQLSFNRGDVNNSFFGNTKGLKYYPKALADVQLEDLTTI